MATITVSVGLTPELWEKSRLYKINRSAIARKAIEDEIVKIENAGGIAAKLNPSTAATNGGDQIVNG